MLTHCLVLGGIARSASNLLVTAACCYPEEEQEKLQRSRTDKSAATNFDVPVVH